MSITSISPALLLLLLEIWLVKQLIVVYVVDGLLLHELILLLLHYPAKLLSWHAVLTCRQPIRTGTIPSSSWAIRAMQHKKIL